MGNIYLVGFMGTGKTAVGRELARRKKWHFLDLDELISLKAKKTIADIFKEKGERYFRRLERQALEEVSRENNFVVACGGGIVLNRDNIKIMRETGKAICLNASIDTIWKRTHGSSHRPLLNVKDLKRQIRLLLKLRAPYYAEIPLAIDTSKLSVKEVAGKILNLAKAL